MLKVPVAISEATVRAHHSAVACAQGVAACASQGNSVGRIWPLAAVTIVMVVVQRTRSSRIMLVLLVIMIVIVLGSYDSSSAASCCY